MMAYQNVEAHRMIRVDGINRLSQSIALLISSLLILAAVNDETFYELFSNIGGLNMIFYSLN